MNHAWYPVVQAYDRKSRIRRWAVPFKTPPVGVFSAEYSDTNFLDPDAVQQFLNILGCKPTAEDLDQQRGRSVGNDDSGSLDSGGGRQKLVLVGELKGSLYVMSAEHVILNTREEVWHGGREQGCGGTGCGPENC